MDTTGDPDIDALHSVTTRLVDAVASIEPDQWILAAPCTDWDLTALIDHITGGNWFTVAILAGQTSVDAMSSAHEMFAGGSATSDAAIQSLHDQSRAFLDPEALLRIWSHVAGDLGGRQILRLRLHDLIVHSWDVQESLRPGATLPDDLVRWGLEELGAEDSLTADHFGLDVGPVRGSTGPSRAYLQVFGR
mgnify:CR=1 FL=1